MGNIFSGWFLINIVAPVALPVAGILVIWLLPLPTGTPSRDVMTTVKDGQLCWAVIAMGASSVYELWEAAIEAHKPIPTWAGLAMVGIFLVMFPAVMVAPYGAVFSTPLRPTPPPPAGPSWGSHYSVFVSSAIMTVVAGFIYTSLHFALASP